jgi:hypothetical protein
MEPFVIRVEHHHYLHDDGQGHVLAQIVAILKTLQTQGTTIMATLDDIQASEEHEGTTIGQLADAVTALKAGMAALTQQLADALAGTTLPPAVQAKVDAAFALSKTNSDAADAILASLAPPSPNP